MQNKGLVRVLAICLTLVCAFYLSFSFVTSHYNNQAKNYAKGDPDKEKQYLDSIADKKVWFGYTVKECQAQEINLGLDLKGGMTVTMEIDVADLLRSLAGHNSESEKFNAALLAAQDDYKKNPNEDFVEFFFSHLDAPQYAVFFEKYAAENPENDKVKADIKENVLAAIDNSFRVLRTRIDRFGVVQPNIQKVGQNRILIELPGVKDTKRVEKLLQGSANLEFYQTYDYSELAEALANLHTNYNFVYVSGKNEQIADTFNLYNKLAYSPEMMYGPEVGMAHYKDTAAISALFRSDYARQILPDNLVLRWTFKEEKGEKMPKGYFKLIALQAVDGKAVLDGSVITDAKSDFQHLTGQSCVNMEMNDEGAAEWKRITGANTGRCVAIVLDDYVYSYPRVNGEIAGGRSEITGNFTVEEAKDLANTLTAGKMPARARIIQETVIGPSLGQEAIRAGLISFIIGFVLILIYMLFYYGLVPGLIADVALLCNVFLLLGILASFKAVLTLPGIAGIVLTMGMAVDANVLIYERIREELRSGKGMRKAIEDGFKGAISAIVDANVTSFLTGFILAYFGTGPIKGFAITYMIGIVSSFLTAVFITRLILDAYCRRENAKELTFTTNLMKNFLQNIHIAFIEKRKVFYCISGTLVIIGLLGLEPHLFGKLNLGIDFSGGRNYTVRFDHAVSPKAIESDLLKVFSEHSPEGENLTVRVITYGSNNQVRVSTNYKVRELSEDTENEIKTLLYQGCKKELGQLSFDQFSTPEEVKDAQTGDIIPQPGIQESQMVGAAIADDIMRSAVWAVLAALLGIFLYILIRFRNFAYSVGAVAALAHDTIIVLGAYALLWRIMPFSMEIDQAFIAAILTVIGYSINDTVVIFDRVREYNTLYPKRDRAQNINEALSATLSRTFSTSMSTFVVLLAIFIAGGESIRGFVFALLLGVIIGTWSSLCVAPQIAFQIQKAQDKRRAAKLAQ